MKLASIYMSLKALHIVFMVTWFAGLFYLPRLFIYHAEARDDIGLERFCIMEKRLFAIMTIGAALTAIFGFGLLWVNPGLLGMSWFHLKLALLALMIIYHLRCLKRMQGLASGSRPDNTRWLRWFNEIPVIFLLLIVALAVLKPVFYQAGGASL